LIDKHASPVGFRKALGLEGEQLAHHKSKLELYRKQVEVYKKIRETMAKRREEKDQLEKRKLVQVIAELHKEFQRLHEDEENA
jgi:hypothetical protein